MCVGGQGVGDGGGLGVGRPMPSPTQIAYLIAYSHTYLIASVNAHRIAFLIKR
jgi:hypothetical protein